MPLTVHLSGRWQCCQSIQMLDNAAQYLRRAGICELIQHRCGAACQNANARIDGQGAQKWHLSQLRQLRATKRRKDVRAIAAVRTNETVKNTEMLIQDKSLVNTKLLSLSSLSLTLYLLHFYMLINSPVVIYSPAHILHNAQHLDAGLFAEG